MNEIAILQRLKITNLNGDDDKWENTAFTESRAEVSKWMKGAHRFEHRKVQWIKRFVAET